MSTILKRACEILEAEAEAIKSIPIDSEFEKAIEILKNCNGHVVTTGMGKAGAIARKVSGTLSSTGTPSIYIHPGEAAHGDLGILDTGDVIIAFSTSGKTREVIEMLKLAHHFGVDTTIGITSHPDSEIHNECPIVINMGEIKEPCHLQLTPSSSTTVMLAIGDALALTLMKEKNITKEDYGLRHHGGYLGELARKK